jgi:hypothetical protein
MQRGVRAVEVIVVEVERKEGGAVIAGRVRPGISPLSSDGLNEAFRLAIGLRSVGFGEEVFEAEFLAGSGKEFGAIGGAAISQHTLNGDAVGGIEVESLLEGGKDAGSLFIREEGCEGETAVVVDGDVEAFDAGTWGAVSTVAGGPNTGLGEASELLDIEVEEIPWGVSFVADDGRFGRFQRRKTVEAVTLEDAGQSGFGDGKDGEDLGVGAALTAQTEDLSFQWRSGSARLAPRSGGVIRKAGRKAIDASASEPSANRLFRNVEEGGCGAEGKALGSELLDHFGSHDRGQFGISVHVVRGECLKVECLSTTTLPNLFPADNLLKHDT